MNRFNVRCCGLDPRWVENVPGKGYLFCGECKSEVLAPLDVQEAPADYSEYPYQEYYSTSFLSTPVTFPQSPEHLRALEELYSEEPPKGTDEHWGYLRVQAYSRLFNKQN